MRPKHPFITAWVVVLALAMIVPTVSWATGSSFQAAPATVVAKGESGVASTSNMSACQQDEAKTAKEEKKAASAKNAPKINPINEFALNRIGPCMKIGFIDMSINKAVIYLWMAALICCTWTVIMARRMKLRPNGKQTFTEMVYEFAYNQIAKATMGDKVFSRYMPYVASLFIFLWVVNMISFFPLPFGHEHAWGIPDLGLYAATSNINVTLALTIVTFGVSHYEGLKHNGPKKYFGSWAPPGSFALQAFVWPIHALSELLRLVSLSVRLFANMLAGHLLILMMLSLTIIISSGFVAIGVVPIALFFYLFEFGLIASLQAFIFAMLSGIYIGFAAEPQH